jgi:hypothetical protein
MGFGSKEVDLKSLIDLKNVDVQVNYEGGSIDPNTKTETHRVNVSAVLFDLNQRNDAGSPEVIKRIKVLGTGTNVALAQNTALALAQTLLGV